MKSDVIKINNGGKGFENAVAETKKVAVYRELKGKDVLHLELMTEETMGMMRFLTGETEGKYRIEDEENECPSSAVRRK